MIWNKLMITRIKIWHTHTHIFVIYSCSSYPCFSLSGGRHMSVKACNCARLFLPKLIEANNKEASNLRITALYAVYLSQRANNAERMPMSWHEVIVTSDFWTHLQTMAYLFSDWSVSVMTGYIGQTDSISLPTTALIVMFMGPTWGPSGADRTQVGPMLAPLTLLSGWLSLCIVTHRMWCGSIRFEKLYIIRRNMFNQPTIS